MLHQNRNHLCRALQSGRVLPQSKTLRLSWRIEHRAGVLDCAQSSGAFAGKAATLALAASKAA
jgi:hypothetical protein